jgi:hypothetical protein
MQFSGNESASKIVSTQDDNYDNAHLLRIERREGDAGGVVIHLPDVTPSSIPCEHVWVIAMTDIENLHGDAHLMES